MGSLTALTYNRGFLITDEEVKSPHNHWKVQSMNGFHIHYDPLNEVQYSQSGPQWVFLLGNVIDLQSFTSDKTFITERLLQTLKHSQDQFFDYIDELSGRFFILYSDGGNAKILSDATGMRTIFYSKNRMFLASHCALLQEYIHSGESEKVERAWLGKYTSQLLPGHYTPYEDIFFLTPNTLLDVKKKEVKRFFPREELQEHSVDHVVKEISLLTKQQIEILSKKYKLALSITAGLDSRATLALTRDYKDLFQYFTYYRSTFEKSLDIDKRIAKEMAENLGLNHKFFRIDQDMNDEEFQELTRVLRKNTFSSHAFKLAKIYLETLSGENQLHIRSNLYEIGRKYFKSHYKGLPKELTTDAMVKIYSSKAIGDEKVTEAFKSYYGHVEMDDIFNYDPYDIFYWEHRMGTWHAQLLLEGDIAHDTFILFNSRKILKLLLSVSDAAKAEHTVFDQLITSNWPILDYWQINSLTKITDIYDEQFESFGLPMNNVSFNGGSVHDPSKKIGIETKKLPNKVMFHMDVRAPLKGDFVQAELPLNMSMDQPSYCLLQIRSPYEKRSNGGNLHYEIHLNGEPMVSEDIADWKESNQVLIKWIPDRVENSLTIKVEADRNCKDWNWGKTARVLIERVTTGKLDSLDSMQVTASSPYSKVFRLAEKN